MAVDRSRAGPGRGRRRRHATGDGHRRPRARPRPAPAAARHPGRAQGPRVRGRRPVHGRLADPGRLSRSVRRAHHGASPRGGRGHPRQDQHGRVRDGLVHRALGLRPDGQPVGAGPRARWQQRWVRRGGGRVPRPAVDRDRHRRLDPAAGGPVRHRRDEADLRPGQPLRDRGLRQLARPDRAVRAGRPGRGGAAARRRRSRRPRFDLVTRAGAGDADRAAGRRRRGRGLAPGQAPRPAARVLRGRHGAGRRGARARGGRRARGRRRHGRGRQPAAHGLRPGHVLHRRPGRGVGQPRPLRRHPVRPAARTRATSSPTTSPPAAGASAPRSSAGSCSAPTRCRPATTTPTT